MLSYRMMHHNAVNYMLSAMVTPSSVVLCAMPTFHTAGLNCYANAALFCGGTVITVADFDARAVLSLLADEAMGVTHFFGVPAIYLVLSQHPAFEHAAFPALQVAGMGGAPAPRSLLDTLLNKGLPLQPSYGMTEVGPAVLVTPSARALDKQGTAGQPVMSASVRVADDQGSPCPPERIGELQVKGPTLFSGYFGKQRGTGDIFHGEWFRTGDAAWQDSEGFFYIVDRYKDMYISGGENVYPAEVENILMMHPAVLSASVIGVPNDRWGEVGCAFVHFRQGAAAAIDELALFCRSRIAAFKVPAHFMPMDELPRNASGKVRKDQLRAAATRVLGTPGRFADASPPSNRGDIA
jgi:fatty-acyl-CoA synthase